MKILFECDTKAMGLRFLMLQNHYRQPMNFSADRLRAAIKTLDRLVMASSPTLDPPPVEIIEAIADDLNTPKALAMLSTYKKNGESEKLFASLRFLGFFGDNTDMTAQEVKSATMVVEPRAMAG